MRNILLLSIACLGMLMLVSCNPTRNSADKNSSSTSGEMKQQEFIVQTNTENIDKVVEEIESYKASIKNRIAPNINMWVLLIDHNEPDPEMVIKALKALPSITEAQTNKKIQNRP